MQTSQTSASLPYKSFPAALHRLRLRAGLLTQAHLAMRVGVSRATISRWETERTEQPNRVRRPGRVKLRELSHVIAQGLEAKGDKRPMTADEVQVVFLRLLDQEEPQLALPGGV